MNHEKRLGTSVLAAILVFGFGIGLVRGQDGPQTPDRPGRRAPADVAGMQDDQLLQETAGELGMKPPAERIDQQLLKWFGLRPKLEEQGISFEGGWTADYSMNLMGGANTEGDTFRHLLDARINVDTRAAFGWAGGTFSLDFQNQSGSNGSDDLGDLQGYDNADSDGRTQINELWYEQLLFDNRLRIKIGKVDANSEFAFPENGGDFVNSSFGHSPTLIAMPTYPDPSTSVNVFVYPTRQIYLGVGVYDGSGLSGTVTGAYGPSRIWHSDSSFFYIGEAGYRWLLKDNTLPGRIAVGVHYHDGDFDKFNGGTQSGAGGFYVILDQKIWHKKYYDKGNEEGVYGFLQYGHADGSVSEVTDHFGAGVTWVGPYTKTNPDTVGLGVSAAKVSDKAGAGFSEDFETSIEAFYNFQVTPYLSVKPDLQYIIHPGADEALDDALVATMRVTLAF